MVTYRKDRAYPHKLDLSEKNVKLCGAILQLFTESVGKKRSEIEEELKIYQMDVKNPKTVQGLSKILFHNSTFSQHNDCDPIALRSKIYSVAAEHWKNNDSPEQSFNSHKEDILQKSKISESEAHNNTETWLYGDISGNQVLRDTKKFKQITLLNRFNTEQVQGLLLSATSLELTIQKKQKPFFRQVMQMLKFFRLMYRVEMEDDDGLTLIIDGPGSVLENSKSYAVELANFFPAILILNSNWSLQARLQIKGKSKNFKLRLDHNSGYESYYIEKGIWYHDKVQNIVEHFNQKYKNEFIAEPTLEIVNLKHNQYLLPDFSVTHAKKKRNATNLKFEWIRYMSEEKKKWLLAIKNEIPHDYVFAFKGKRSQYQPILESLGENIMCFNNQLTAPAILKKVKDFRRSEQ
ncbi:MAG: DUF790 family protein [Proteobacteria bacterium]|nr:DUF790 family protein [Pseudomonadota bacterium]